MNAAFSEPRARTQHRKGKRAHDYAAVGAAQAKKAKTQDDKLPPAQYDMWQANRKLASGSRLCGRDGNELTFTQFKQLCFDGICFKCLQPGLKKEQRHVSKNCPHPRHNDKALREIAKLMTKQT